MPKQPETKVKFSIFNKEFNEGINEMSKENKKLRKEFKLQEEQMKDTATATDKLEHTINRLGAEQDIVKKKISAYDDQLQKVKQTYGENSNEANKLSNELLDLRISEQKIENAINRSKAAIEQQSQSMTEGRQDAEKFQKALDGIAEKANNAGDSLSTGLSLPLAGIGTIAGMSAMDMDSALRLMTGSLGATGDEAEQLKADMRAVWEDGFGDNPEQVARSIALIKQNIKGINDGEELKKVTKNMLILSNVTENDMSEATRGVNQLMHNFGLTAQEAMDLFTKGQQKGLNFSNEMFDNISEYAPLFKDMGFSAGEYFAILENGTKNGAYNLDYINDLMKEFNIRVQDGSEKTSDAFGEMSKETQNLFKEFENGEATTEDLFKAVIPELEKMDDQVKANQIAVELFGTKMEDMGSETVYALDDMNDSFKNTEGAMDALAKSQEEAFGIKFKKTLRSVLEAVEPIGEELLEMADEVTPKIEELADWFVNLDDETKDFIATSGLLAAGLGPFLKIVGTLTTLTGGLTKGLGGKGLAGTIINLVSKSGPIGLAVGALGGLAIAVGTATIASSKNNEITLKEIETRQKQIETTDKMIARFEDLERKNRLSTDEMIRYMDNLSKLEDAEGEAAIKKIKDEQADLLEKSTLTNEEMVEFLELNQGIIEKAPSTADAISKEGNAYAENLEALKKLNNFEKQRLEDETYTKLTAELKTQKINLQEQKELQAQIKTKEAERNEQNNLLSATYNEIKTSNLKIVELKNKMKTATGEELIDLEVKLSREERHNEQLKAAKLEHEIILEKMDKQIDKKQTSLDKTNKELEKFQNLKYEYEQIILSNLDINYEKGKGLIAVGKEIESIKIAKNELDEKLRRQEITTAEYQDQNGELRTQLGRLQAAQGELENINELAGKTIYDKKVNISTNPSIYDLNAFLSDPVNKHVNVITSGGGHVIPAFAAGTESHKGGPALVGEEGPELVKQGNKLSLQSFGIMPDLQSGAKVFTAEQTEKILARLPGYAGGVGVSPEMSRSLERMGENLTTTIRPVIRFSGSNDTNTTERPNLSIEQHNSFTSQPLSPSEIARKNKQMLRDVTSDWR